MQTYENNYYPQNLSLDGEWDFTYTPTIGPSGIPEIPHAEQFAAKMPVPAYWDDHIPRMQNYDFWSMNAKFNPDFRHIDFPMGDNMPPDASLPYLVGVGWYRKKLFIPLDWKHGQISLYIGGVVLEAWVWVNGNLAKYHLGHSTPFEISVSNMLKYDAENEIIIAVANTRTDRLGCVIRGFKGFSAGICRTVFLKVSERVAIKDCYIYPDTGLMNINWLVKLEGITGENVKLNWQIKDTEKNSILSKGTLPANCADINWTTDTVNMQTWSEHSPKLYEVEITLLLGEKVADIHNQSFGLRLLKRQGTALQLNGHPVFLRGATEHAYFPLTCTPPRDIETYRNNIRKLKALGFNWLRFHTWVPSEEYMDAADQLGIMIQVESPLGFEKQEWLDILMTCRKHPSVVLYCCGNEELLDENKIVRLKEMAELCHMYVPDALFNPQEALRGIEYYFKKNGTEIDIATNQNLTKPFPHNPVRLQALREFSDVFGQYPLGHLSYISVNGDWRTLDQRLEIYQRPCLSHEIGIHGNYINLDLEHRYEGTRIGSEIFASVRRNLKKEGLLERAATYYKNSCAWMKILRKQVVETARKCKYNAGYDLLGAIDYHWHRSGYPCGIMNEFYELKPGESKAEVLQYNGESLLLLDHTNNRNLKCDDDIKLDLYSSLYGVEALAEGAVYWYLSDEENQVYQRGESKVYDICNGKMEKLICIHAKVPCLCEPSKIILHARLSGDKYEISNSWDFWAYPEINHSDGNIVTDQQIGKNFKSVFSGHLNTKNLDLNCIHVVSALDQDQLDFLCNGGKVILLGNPPFPVLPTTFQIAVAGRVQGNLATVIEDHPLMNRFPHNGYCDWQFYNMLEGGNAVFFHELNIPFKPIIEVVSSFKLIRKQACLFEISVGKGKLLVCTLNLEGSDPGATYLLKSMLEYTRSNEFYPTVNVAPEEMRKMLNTDLTPRFNFATDEAIDPNVQKKYK